MNTIYHTAAHEFLDQLIMKGEGLKGIDLVLTSPPYNTGRNYTSERAREHHEGRYDVHLDNMTDNEYIDWTVELFNKFSQTVNDKGVILYNMSYSTDITNMNDTYHPHEIMWRTVANIIERTDYTTVDCIIWKKGSALPNNASKNKLTRIVEFIYVFVKKGHIKDFNANKAVKSVSKTGQNFYENIFNFVEAKNNDGSTKLNKATYSSDLCGKLLDIYAQEGALVYDPFMGTGTTAVACKQKGLNYVGTEISEAQIAYAEQRIEDTPITLPI